MNLKLVIILYEKKIIGYVTSENFRVEVNSMILEYVVYKGI